MTEEPFEQKPISLSETGIKSTITSGNSQLSQNRSAVFATVIILFSADLLNILFAIIQRNNSNTQILPTNPQIVISIIIDVILGINLLRGKSWARTWIIIRSALGIVIWGAILAVQGEFGAAIMNTGVLLALILLVSGTSNPIKIGGSVALAIIATIGGMIFSIFGSTMNMSSTPEVTTTPESFLTYTSEGFFSIRYPPDWSPNISAISEAEAGMKNYLSDIGMGTEANKVQVAFLGSKITTNGFAFITITLEPKQFWPIESVVESTYQWSKQNVGQYIEHSRAKTTICGKSAVIQIYQGEDVDSVLTEYMIAYISGNKFWWCVTCGSDPKDFESNRTTFDQIVRSLKIEY
jgi:hypothetical protein